MPRIIASLVGAAFIFVLGLALFGTAKTAIEDPAKETAIANQWVIEQPTVNPETGEASTRKNVASDRFPSPFANEVAARAANNNALPPDLSLMTKARHDGSNYVHALLMGYRNQAGYKNEKGEELLKMFPDAKTPQGLHFNPWFANLNIAMPPPLTQDGQVTYSDGTKATKDQMARDIAAFLTWTAEPNLDTRHGSIGAARGPPATMDPGVRHDDDGSPPPLTPHASQATHAPMNDDLKALIRTIPDFPKPGIQFRDITTLLLDPAGLAATIDRMVAATTGPVDLIAGIEARGFLFAAALAVPLKAGVLLIRKDGKLPGATIAEDYALEYGQDRIAMHEDALVPGQRVLLVDDLIATGGTARAAVRLLRKAGAIVEQAQFVIDLPDLGGADALRADGVQADALFAFEGH
ncbi:hypothetical protein WR25_03489 [Diploscapter pachys]|uniref:Adenine phosphoribosyltransferase n=2 Tax=cellular organisms TaxID=131567 RepID=A0A2A2KA94_9BILA|nr:hypothetical protein WR25_03489 [Diploscapter pachys]